MRTAIVVFLSASAAFAQESTAAANAAEARARAAAARDQARTMARSAERSGNEYQRGTRFIDRRDYEAAIKSFDQVIEAKDPKADGALYWKAYAQNKLGRRDQAQATLAQLQNEHPQSRWLNDAKALDVEVRQASGRPVSPDAEGDEELKIFAVNSLMSSDPERAVPVLTKVLRDPKAQPKLKERALFVLAQSKDPKARAALGEIAKGGGNPDLQMKAVEFLGVFGKDNAPLLNEIYSGTNDVAVRRAVIRGMMHSRDKERLLALAKSEQNEELRREAIRMLGAMQGQAELNQLYQSETSPELRREIVRGFMMTRDVERLLTVAKGEKDSSVRREAIQMLGTMRDEKIGPALTAIYAEGDSQAKQAVIDALFMQKSAGALIDLARKETDPKMKRAVVERLSLLKSKEATDYMMEVLNK